MNLDYGFQQFDKQDQAALQSVMARLGNVPNPTVVEVGCWTGRSTSVIAQYCKEKGGRVYAVDHFLGSLGTALIEHAERQNVEEIFLANMKELEVDDIVEVYPVASAAASTMFPDNYFDMVFIDADHLYLAVKRDIELWLPKLKRGGIMAGHDFDVGNEGQKYEYDERYLGEDCVNRKHHGVIKAVTERFRNVEHPVPSNLWVIINDCR